MKLVVVTQGVRAKAQVPADERRASESGVTSTCKPSNGRTARAGTRMQAAGVSPEMRLGGDSRRTLRTVRRGQPTVASGRKATGPGSRRQESGPPPGSKSGAGRQRGNSGTWESHRSPGHLAGMGDRRSTALACAGASTRARARTGHHERTEAGQGSGRERQAKWPERGRVAV
jgi:hypothetical protein